MERHTASQKFQFRDPIDWQFNCSPLPATHMLLEDHYITVAQGPSITKWKSGSSVQPPTVAYSLSGHNAQITCMRLLPSAGLTFSRSGGDSEDTLLVTSSRDHTIRLWGKGRALRTFRGHSGPVTTLADGLLGRQYGTSVLASGGMDGTIRLWALSSGQKRGHSPLQKTLHSHEHAIRQLAVAEYNPTLLVSAAKDLKIRVWDVTSSSSVARTGALVGSTRGPGVPVGLTCKGSLCFIAGGTSFLVIDLRSMEAVATATAHGEGIRTFSLPPSGKSICTGGEDKTAKLWDLRNIQDSYATLGNHCGAVSCVYMDAFKAVTGGFADRYVNVWDAETGVELNIFDSLADPEDPSDVGVSTIAVSGPRIVTATCGSMPGVIRLKDFSNCALSSTQTTLEADSKFFSKFWEISFDEDV